MKHIPFMISSNKQNHSFIIPCDESYASTIPLKLLLLKSENLFIDKHSLSVLVLFSLCAALLHCQLICSSLNKLFF